MPTRTFNRLDEDKKERIMRSAIAEFLTQGFEGTKIETIAANAEVAKGSIYQYFEDKKSLFLYAVTWTIEYFLKHFDRQSPLADMDVFDYFLSSSRERFALLEQEPQLLAFSIATYTGKYGSLTADIIRELTRMANQEEIKLIRNGQRRGTIRTDLDDESLLLFFQGVTEKFQTKLMENIIEGNTTYTEERFIQMQETVGKMVKLLKNGMGG